MVDESMRLYVSTLNPCDSLRRCLNYNRRKDFFTTALKRILLIRKQTKNNQTLVRKFVRPESSNFNALGYFHLFDLQATSISEPPLTMVFTNREIKNAIKTGTILDSGHFPNGTQAVKRTAKLLTEASSKVVGREKRNYYTLNVLKARSEANIAKV